MSKALTDDASVASVVCWAAQKELGDGWRLWEPETLWLELDRRGIDVPVGNRQQLMAGRNLLLTGRFFYDGLVFDRTSAAFSNEVLDIDGFDDAHVMHMAWAVDEARRIERLFDDVLVDFDREPTEVAALQLFEEGFLVAPAELSFAQDALDRRWCDKSLKKEILELWGDLLKTKKPLQDVPFPETRKGVQLAKLASVELFLAERRGTREKQLARLL